MVCRPDMHNNGVVERSDNEESEESTYEFRACSPCQVSDLRSQVSYLPAPGSSDTLHTRLDSKITEFGIVPFCVCRHLIGFFIFLGLTVYTFMNLPHVDMPHLPHIPTLTEIQHALQQIDLPHISLPESLSSCLHSDKDSYHCLFVSLPVMD